MNKERKWKAVYGNGLLGVSVVSVGEGIVCEVAHHGCCRDSEAEEDARLIAAAPDMLKALKGTMRTMQMMHGADCRCVECKDARAAIQKAEGIE